jgi:hypothetical protein
MPIRAITPIVVSNGYNYHHHEGEDKTFAAIWIALHILPIIWIIITYILALLKRDKYYHSFDDENVAWTSILLLLGIDILFVVASFIYSLL